MAAQKLNLTSITLVERNVILAMFLSFSPQKAKIQLERIFFGGSEVSEILIVQLA